MADQDTKLVETDPTTISAFLKLKGGWEKRTGTAWTKLVTFQDLCSRDDQDPLGHVYGCVSIPDKQQVKRLLSPVTVTCIREGSSTPARLGVTLGFSNMNKLAMNSDWSKDKNGILFGRVVNNKMGPNGTQSSMLGKTICQAVLLSNSAREVVIFAPGMTN